MDDYKEKYENGVECIQEILSGGADLIRTSTLRKRLQPFFPELKENENNDEKIRKELTEFLKSASGGFLNSAIECKTFGEWLAWLEKQKDNIKFPNSAYTSNKDVTEFADKYSHIVWEKLMNNFKKIENYSIGCNDVSDIVLNAIINTYIWLEGQGQIKESHISQHESETCEENNKFLTNEDERIKETLKGFVKGYSAFINGQWRLGDFTVNRIVDWLEKHSEYSWKPTEAQLEALDYAYNSCSDTERGNYYESVLANLIADLHKLCEKQDEKKPIFNADDWYVSEVDGKIHNAKFIEKQDEEKSTNEVEPKFKVGDWVILNGVVAKILDKQKYGFVGLDIDGKDFFCNYGHTDSMRLWTIKDAKDGDVLVSNSKGGQEVGIVKRFIGKYGGHNKCFETYCYSDLDGTFRIGEYMGGNSIYPVTQKQCAQLFHQMKEAGYKWDPNKKEVKTIEQKSADKIEPKFHEDDWIIFNGLILHIDEVVNGYYRTTSIGDGIHNSYDWNIDNAARLWTIQDAKDGDVLLEEETGEPFIYNGNRATYFLGYFLGAYCGIYNGEFNPYGNIHHWGKNSCPATKEQCDLLFQKMKEAGYEWDAEKKELKKMEVVSKESEDERIREQLCDFLRDNMLYQDAQYFISWLEKQSKKKFTPDEVLKIRQELYQSGYNDGYKHGYNHGQNNIAIALGKESIDALEHFVRSIRESGYASPYDNRTKLVYRLLEQLKQIVK